MESNHNLSLLDESYILNRLVYINSANHAYSEIMLNDHMAMFGDNNAGKTASLAGTKLLLFPESDFYNCEKKFIFEGKKGLHSMEDSHNFYFPDPRSFIVLEVKNPEGTFCMVLYKTTNFGYARFFIPVPYKQLRPVFWDSDSLSFSPDISVEAVKNFTKANDGIQVSKEKEIASLMFSSFRGLKKQKRFCVLPLKDGEKESIDAFRNIYQLSFEAGNSDTKSLPAAIATLLEMGRGRKEERLDANLLRLADEHASLLKKNEWLQGLSNAKPTFSRVVESYVEASQKYKEYSVHFHSVSAAFMKAQEEYAPEYEQLESKHKEKSKELENIKQQLESLVSKITRSEGAVEQLKASMSRKSNKLTKDKELLSTYADTPINEIIRVLNNELELGEKELQNLRDEGGVQRSLSKNVSKRKELTKDIAELEKLISDSESTVLNQIEKHDADVMNSINPALAKVAAKLEPAVKDSISGFTKLFDFDKAGCLTFLGNSISDIKFSSFDLGDKAAKWKVEKSDKEEEIHILDTNIIKQKKAIQNQDINKLIETTEKEIKGIENDISSISGITSLEIEVNEQESSLKIKGDHLITDRISLHELQKDHGILKGEWFILQRQLSEIKGQQQQFESISRCLDTAKVDVTPSEIDIELLEEELTIESAMQVIEKAKWFSQSFTGVREGINQLRTELPHPDVDAHKEYIDLGSCAVAVQAYESAFATLDYEKHQYTHDIRSHNQLVSNQLNELKEAKNLLFNFVSAINKELNSKRISNLSEIKLYLDLTPSFSSLLATLEKHDIQDDSLLESQFYEALAEFVNKYFNKKSRRLKMRDIISSVTYHYKLEETGEVITKSQSGGTSSAITAFVLAVLLKRITPQHVQLQMPVIVDEIGTLDGKNMQSTIKQIAEHGFSIFCATPNFNAFVSQKVGKWIMIDKARIRQPLVHECHMNILPEHIESFGEPQSEA